MMNEDKSIEIHGPQVVAPSKIMIQPLTDSCDKIHLRKEHICLGISPFNSLFSEEYLVELVRHCVLSFKTFHIFLPDEPTIFTLQALGYSEDESRKKMRKQINWLRNKISKALSANDVNPEANLILDWSQLSKNKIYLNELGKVRCLFDQDSQFRAVCMEGSRWVLQNKLPESEVTETKLLTAAHYLMAELPLFAKTNEILGIESSLFCYHQSIELLEMLYSHRLSYLPSAGQGFGKIISASKELKTDEVELSCAQ